MGQEHGKIKWGLGNPHHTGESRNVLSHAAVCKAYQGEVTCHSDSVLCVPDATSSDTFGEKRTKAGSQSHVKKVIHKRRSRQLLSSQIEN